MNRLKKNVARLIAIMMFVGISLVNVNVAHAATLMDIDTSSDYAKAAIMALAEQNIITGDSNGYFNPQNTVTRAEMITMIVKALGVDTTNVSDTPTFQDVPKEHWAYDYVEAAYKEGIVKGLSEEIFGKDDQCTREQMTVMFIRSLGVTDEIDNADFTNIDGLSDKDMISSWAKDAVEFSLSTGVMNGTADATFSPKGNAERQQVAVVTHRVINDKENILDYAHENSNFVKYANLFEAIGDAEDYRGDFRTDALMNIYAGTPVETVTFTINGEGAVNGMDSQMNMHMSMASAGQSFLDLNLEMIHVDNKLYMREAGADKWMEAAPEDIEGVTPFEGTAGELQPMNEQLLNFYNNMPIKEVGSVDIDGVNTTKYTLSLDYQDIKNLFPDEFLEENFVVETPVDNATIEMEFYLGDQNQIIKQAIIMDGDFQVEDEVVTFDMTMNVNYYNIGSDITITAPAPEDIEVPEAPEV